MGKHNHGLIRAVDTDLAKNPKPVSLFLPFFFLILVFMIGRAWISAAALVLWAVLAAIALPWYAFVGWRAWRLARAAFWQGDRNYDITGKYRLPPRICRHRKRHRRAQAALEAEMARAGEARLAH